MKREKIFEKKYRLYEGDEDIILILELLISSGKAKNINEAISYIVRNYSK